MNGDEDASNEYDEELHCDWTLILSISTPLFYSQLLDDLDEMLDKSLYDEKQVIYRLAFAIDVFVPSSYFFSLLISKNCTSNRRFGWLARRFFDPIRKFGRGRLLKL